MTTYPHPLTAQDEKVVIERIAQGDKAAEHLLVEHNMRLVLYIANKYRNTKIDADDLLSIGSIGLMKAVQSFDFTKKIKFATYASRCIQNEILMYLRREKKTKKDMYLEDSIKSDGEGNQLTVYDVIGSDRFEIENSIEETENLTIIGTILQSLPDEERQIICYRYGLTGERKKQAEIAHLFNISQSYVSRIERNVIKKIKKRMAQYEKIVS